MTWLVTGGAGYIGAHLVRSLRDMGRQVVVLDDLSTGYANRVPPDVPLVRASVLDMSAVTEALRRHGVEGVIHLAGKKDVGESLMRPYYYHHQNVVGVKRLLDAMNLAGTKKLVFSSSCAVYGNVDRGDVDESVEAEPVSPYGLTKLLGENLIRDAGSSDGLSWISLRYFNVAGCAEPLLADTRAANLIPMVFRALNEGHRPAIFGGDYPTPDGTCVRDYIHVADVVSAHLAASERLARGSCDAVYNIGRGCGSSVREIMDMISEVIGLDVDAQVVARRPGDLARVVASTKFVEADLGWVARCDNFDMISSAWACWQARRPRTVNSQLVG